MWAIKNKALTFIMTTATAIALNYGPANADLLLLKDGSMIYNHRTIRDKSKGMRIKTPDGKELFIPRSKISDSIFVPDIIDKETADKLADIKRIENWGQENLGIKKSSNFLRYYENSRTNYVLFFCDKLKLPKHYGTMGSRFFPTEEYALKMKEELESKGYDVFHRSIEASMGNPVIYQKFLESDLDLKAHIAFHENMHMLVSLPPDLNEAIANIAGHFGALEYLTETFGKDSEQTKEHIKRINKFYNLSELVIESYNKLDELFKSSLSDEAKLKKKEEIIGQLGKKIMGPTMKKNIGELNNASLAVQITYMKFAPLMKEVYEKAGSTKEAVKVFKNLSDLIKRMPNEDDGENGDFIDKRDPRAVRAFAVRHLKNYIR